MRAIKEFSKRLYQIVTVACVVLPITLPAQTHMPDSLRARPEPLAGLALGTSHSPIKAFLTARGWTQTTTLDTLTVIAGPGIRGSVGAQTIRTRDLADDDMRTLMIVMPRGSKVQYAVAPDTGYENPVVMFDDDSVAAKGTITLTGDHALIVAAERTIAVGSANRKLYELLRQQLTARDPLSVYVDIECETERLLKAFPDSAEKLIDAAEQKAVDPTRDAKALRRIDGALGGHMFEGCARDRRAYQRASQKPSPTR